MSIPIHPAKLSPPVYLEGTRFKRAASPSWIYPRPRLIDALNSSPPGTPICLIAPAGSGKTTLVAAWSKLIASQQDDPRRFAWLTLDEGDNDAARLLAGLVAALHSAQPGLGVSSLAEVEAPQQPDLFRLFSDLLLEIEASQRPLVLVLDDCHAITAAKVQQALAFLSAHCPNNFQPVFIADGALPETLDELRQRERWCTVEWDDLRLTPQEAQEMLTTVYASPISTDQAEKLVSRTQGAVLPIHLAGLALQQKEQSETFWEALEAQSASPIEFLLDQALELQLEAVREFLLFTSILKYLNGAVCDDLVRLSPSGLQAPGRGQASLEHLSKSHLLTSCFDAKKTWFQYHPLLGRILKDRLKRNFPGSLNILHQKASEWFEKNNDPEAAIFHALEAGDEERASALIEANSLTWISYGQLTTTLHWLGRISASLVLLRPWLCLAEAWATAEGGWYKGTETLLAVVETALSGMAPVEAQRAQGHMAAIRMQIAANASDWHRQETLARQALEFLPPKDRLIRCHVALRLGTTLRQRGRLSAAAEALTEAVACANQGENRAFAVFSFCRLADLYWQSGALQKALAVSEEALSVAQYHQVEAGYPLLTASLAHFYAGLILYERDELEIAQSHYENGLAYCEAWGIPEYIAAGQTLLAETHLARGNVGYAQQLAAQAQMTLAPSQGLNAKLHKTNDLPIQRTSPLILASPGFIAARLAMLYLSWQDWEKVNAWMNPIADQMTGTGPIEIAQAPVYISLARTLAVQGRYLEARRLVRQLISISEISGAQHILIQSLTLQAYLMQQTSDYQGALATLRRALTLAESENYVRTFFELNPKVNLLLARLSESGPGSVYARFILNAFERQAGRTININEPIPLSIRPITRPLPGVETASYESLTEREKEILRLLDSYLNEVEIAAHLSISYRTVELLIHNICKKLGVQNAKQATLRARELKIL